MGVRVERKVYIQLMRTMLLLRQRTNKQCTDFSVRPLAQWIPSSLILRAKQCDE